jgi:hypothetical protein
MWWWLYSWAKVTTVHSTLLITGHMSWGDSVDGCVDIEFFWASGAAAAAGFVFPGLHADALVDKRTKRKRKA